MMIDLARKLWHTIAPAAIVLLYHRIETLQVDPWSLAVTPNHFAEQLAVLKRDCQIVRLAELVQACQAGRTIRRAVVITFDDGYADNLLNASPLLIRAGIPATIFLTSGPLGADTPFWWDELAQHLLMPGQLPALLTLSIGTDTHQWQLGSATSYSATEAERNASWIAWGEAMPTARHQIYRELWEILHPLHEEQRQAVLAQLRQWSGQKAIDPINRMLSPTEVRRLAETKLIEIGAHTLTHPTLAALTTTEQRHEIQQSKTDLEAIISQPVASFSYPYGRRSDYSAETITLVQQAGYQCACSNFADLVDARTDCFQIPRFNVSNCDGITFKHQIDYWFRRGAV